jgi:hypothetical protein
MCLDVGPHFFVSIGENFFDAQDQANCTDEAQHRDFRSIRGDLGLEVSLSAAKWWLGADDQPDWHSNGIERNSGISQ